MATGDQHGAFELQGSIFQHARHLADGSPAAASSAGVFTPHLALAVVAHAGGFQNAGSKGRTKPRLAGRFDHRIRRAGHTQATKCAFSRARSCATDTTRWRRATQGVPQPGPPARRQARFSNSVVTASATQTRLSPRPGVFVGGLDVVVAHQPGRRGWSGLHQHGSEVAHGTPGAQTCGPAGRRPAYGSILAERLVGAHAAGGKVMLQGHFNLLGAEGFQALAQFGASLASGATANRTALAAPAVADGKRRHGMPLGICTMLCSESTPAGGGWPTGTPRTGTVVLAAIMPGGWAAPPAPAMMAFRPRPAAASGVNKHVVGHAVGRDHADLVCNARLLKICTACCMVSQSLLEPMTTPIWMDHGVWGGAAYRMAQCS